ncbi:hypothetical protein [Stenotrophomonas tuberculopleuritidis]|uniref:hypothetical protein n=1 Tax=Stenotrophomonas tuberculopleuritidis TaxID=3055079 RepID=UPI0026E5223B|nr:hypothetical protein [Stenotrophomonas sp. 704A1]
MRGRRPALASLLAWVAMLGLLLGTLPLLPMAHTGSIQAVQPPLEERGGERPVHEEAPAKLRRCASTPCKAPHAPPPPLLLASHWLRSELDLIPTAPAPCGARPDWPLAAPDMPWADAPGRRQQRGQAPPLA